MGGVTDMAQGLIRIGICGPHSTHVGCNSREGDDGFIIIEPRRLQTSQDGDTFSAVDLLADGSKIVGQLSWQRKRCLVY